MADGDYIYEFGQFQLNPAEHQLLRGGEQVPITAKALQTLLVLVRNPGHLVEKSKLLTEVWGDTFVEEGNLSVTISMLRKALQDDRNQHKYIETISRQGYRFLPQVERIEARPPSCVAPQTSAPAEGPQTSIEGKQTDSSFEWKIRARGWTLSALGAVVVGILTYYVSSLIHVSARARTINSIAVIPFEVQSSNQAAAQFGIGVADDLISRFGSSDHIEVRPASTVLRYSETTPNISGIASEQNVDAVLAGKISDIGGGIQISAKLVAANGDTLWGDSFHGSFADLSDIEDRIETQVVKELYPAHPQAEQPKQTSRDREAYRLYTEGRYFWNKRTEQGFRRSIECFQQAVLRDQAFADAYAGLADSYTLLASYGVEPATEAYPNAKAAALKALQLNDTLAEAHTSLGMVALYYEWNWPEADKQFHRAIELNPDYSLAHTWFALYLAATGQPDQAARQAQRAKELDPVSLMANTELGRVYYWNRQYDKAITNFKFALELDPYFARAHTRLGMALAAQKDYQAALREFNEASRLSSPDPYLDGLVGYSEALAGNTKLARRILADLITRSKRRYVPAFSVGLLCVGLGDRDQAIDWLERAYQDRSTYMVYANVDPLLDPVRSDPRFSQLMRRMGFRAR